MSAFVAALVLICFWLGYRYYASFIGKHIYKDRESFRTPANTLEDGQDYVPTPKHILFGHHFTSIAGAAPIIGPCVAAYWGWLPAILWVVFGTIFMGAVHDFGALVMSVREKGHSVAEIAGKIMHPRVRTLFLSFVVVFVWLVLAVFAMAMAGLFVSQPTSVLPIHIEIVVAVIIGWLLYKRKIKSTIPSIVALLTLYLFIWIGTKAPIDFTQMGMNAAEARHTWIWVLLIYAAIASLLPVWLLLQPRDYINSHQLFVGLILLFAGIFIAHPEIDAPALRLSGEDAPSIFPLLFVTIACGAISGFHGLVSSGTTSKQIKNLKDARLIGYGGMMGEGVLALASTLAAVAGISLVGECHLPSQGQIANLNWETYYGSWAHAGANKAAAFVLGGGAFLESLGLSAELSRTLMAVLVISFAATTLDTATRIQRYILGELGQALQFKPLENKYIATLIAVIPALALALVETTDPTTGQAKQVGWILWPIFGATNQMLAGLTLLVLTLYFWSKKRPILPLAIPMVLVLTIAFFALLAKLQDFIQQENYPLTSLNILLLGLFVWMIFEGLKAKKTVKELNIS